MVKKNIKFIQINLHHARGATAVLCRKFIKENISVSLIQEPWAHDGAVLGIPTQTGKLIYDDKVLKPRAAILIKRGIKFVPITEFISKDIAAIRMVVPTTRGKTEAYFASAYFPGDVDEAPPPEVAAFITFCKENNKQFIIGCDANSHHTIWGSTDINKRGECLLEYISANNIDLCNKGDHPTFITKNRKEVLDLTLCSPTISTKIMNWHVSDEESLSDHKHIVFDYNAGELIKVTYRNPRNTNWEMYKQKLAHENIPPNDTIISTKQLDSAAQNLAEKIIQAYEASCPQKEELSIRDVPWWNKTLSKLRKKSRQLFNKAKSSGQWDLYRKVLTAYNNELRKSKRRNWRSYCENIEKTPDVAKLQKVLSKDHVNGLGNIKKPDGNFTKNNDETLQIMMQTHFPGSNLVSCDDRENTEVEDSRPTRTAGTASSIVHTIFTKSKVEWALNSFEPFKSPGKDGVFPVLLHNAGEPMLESLTNIFTASLTLGHIPEVWSQARVIFIPKAGRKDKTTPKAFRPISLTSTMLKIMEKIIYEYIKSCNLQTYPLNKSQFAYQSNKSTVTALHSLVTKIEKTLDNKEIALVAFLDIEGAFDNASYRSIKKINGTKKF